LDRRGNGQEKISESNESKSFNTVKGILNGGPSLRLVEVVCDLEEEVPHRKIPPEQAGRLEPVGEHCI
jgi:hypothetical protein